ncbi:Lrp/AsnC family transcriptional regulator [Leekyejoonella antrihumi]|uniref:Lrp/AsnC family transcriptional regulator n=1 Tax=Leekyejoonella antrihumi TaxID=1660198 RepID=A0A563DU63_9MICO|nr:Lrp/AsnC family transcriptional regulator [Leekyejoonella antrihumi]TWP33800.1 Lrp/AsnC family transcriptional regulator [Leekyejoonella antrihumi]
MSSSLVDSLDLQIVAALQIDARVAWRTVAVALDEQERTIARRGARLLSSGAVRVTGLSTFGESLLVRVRCAPGTTRIAAQALAARRDTTFSYLLAGAADCCAELICPPARLNTLLLDDLPAVPGVTSCESLPVLRYLRAIHEWHPFALPQPAVDLLQGAPVVTPDAATSTQQRSTVDRAILRALREDGRTTHEDLARLAGISPSTARRRVEAMRAEGALFIRAVANPTMLGLGVQAMLWVCTAPTRIESASATLLSSPQVRYAAVISGRYQLAVEVAVPERSDLYDFVTRAAWLDHVESVETTLVIQALKSSGVPMPQPRTDNTSRWPAADRAPH